MHRIYFVLALALIISSCTALHLLPSKKVKKIQFELANPNPNYQFFFPNPAKDTILQRLRAEYPIEALVKNAKSEQEKVLLVLNWVRNQWEHNGWNDAKTQNACVILDRAQKGEKFRCVEYGYVLKSVLNALGMKARTLGLKTRDVEKTRMAAGHVLSEVWLSDHQKWAMVDAQFDAMPVLDGVPLNAVELQSAIKEKKAFKFIHLSGDFTPKEHKDYMRFIPHYLYYFDIRFDESQINYRDKFKVNGNSSLMLMPLGAKKPVIFQRKYPIDDTEYTHSLADFYRKPI